jgi:hypothetical protein
MKPDFMQLSHLSAIHAGVTLGAPYNVDLDGNVRGAGSAWDIGAYEYVRR